MRARVVGTLPPGSGLARLHRIGTRKVRSRDFIARLRGHAHDPHRIYADFNGRVAGPKNADRTAVVLDTFGSLRDLANAGIVLEEGLPLIVVDASDDVRTRNRICTPAGVPDSSPGLSRASGDTPGNTHHQQHASAPRQGCQNGLAAGRVWSVIWGSPCLLHAMRRKLGRVRRRRWSV